MTGRDSDEEECIPEPAENFAESQATQRMRASRTRQRCGLVLHPPKSVIPAGAEESRHNFKHPTLLRGAEEGETTWSQG